MDFFKCPDCDHAWEQPTGTLPTFCPECDEAEEKHQNAEITCIRPVASRTEFAPKVAERL